MSDITDIIAREVLDSRGNPTVEAEVRLSSGAAGIGIVPSGASTGVHEALELRDGGTRFAGKGVLTAIANIRGVILPCLTGKDVTQQELIDNTLIELDGTDNKSKLGANAILAVSLASANAGANHCKESLYKYLRRHCGSKSPMSLPVPMMNVINGGAHASNNVDIQEYMIVPFGAPTFREALRYGVEVFHSLKSILTQQGLQTAVGDEGGFAPNLPNNEAGIEVILEAIHKTGLQVGKDIGLSLDVASSEFYQEEKYVLRSEERRLNSEEFVAYLSGLVEKYPILSIEDGLAEDDWSGWKLLTEKLGKTTQLVGDDVFVTNPKILVKGIEQSIANSLLVKFNQIGTLTETFAAINLAQAANYTCVVSHRSGETEDTSIADLAVATGVGQIKTGSLSRTDRVAKYNRLLRIEEELGTDIVFAGKESFKLC